MPKGDYWKKRIEEIEKMAHNKGAEYARYIDKQFEASIHSLEKEIELWYRRLADNNEISLEAAKELLRKNELEDFHMSVEEYIKKGESLQYDTRWAQQLENASAKVHISRLEALKLQMQQEYEVLYGNLTDGLDRTMRDIYTNGYYHTAYEIMKGSSLGSSFHVLDTRRIEHAVNTTWANDGKNFRARCWTNKEKLVSELNTVLTQSIIRGDSPQKAIDQLAKRMKVSKYNAGRLIMTESAFISSQSQKDCYEELGVEQFEFVATLDSRTSDICREMDGKVFQMSDYEIGVNAPPLHCFCRSCTVPYFEDDFGQKGKRAARDENGKTTYVDGSMTYREWEKQFVTENGLAAGAGGGSNIPPHDQPAVLEKVDFSNKDMVLSKITEYENVISNSSIENAVVVTKSGKVIQCFGDLNGVYPNIDLKDELAGAVVTHNHPIGSCNEYSFSKNDINMFMDNNLEVLRGIDERYVYELNRNPGDIDPHVSLSEWDEYSTRHEEVISMAERLGIGYRRYPRE
ncbi:MAG: minor capsid protein [Lachnospiraceae bacterium]|nr:minor capsid protein [Lachnospiraceae bacterium]MBO5146691.1 minor capsid protein [Lachnospiraceae bacterium]